MLRLRIQLIRDVGITQGDETRVGFYVGLLVSRLSLTYAQSLTGVSPLKQGIFFATEAMTVMHWSRLSDHIGRKPVILTGLFGLSLSMYCLGLSKTFWGAVLRSVGPPLPRLLPSLLTMSYSRSLNGALNGNIGVLKCMLAEITDSTNYAQAYSYLPIAWSTGGTLGYVYVSFCLLHRFYSSSQTYRRWISFEPCRTIPDSVWQL